MATEQKRCTSARASRCARDSWAELTRRARTPAMCAQFPTPSILLAQVDRHQLWLAIVAVVEVSPAAVGREGEVGDSHRVGSAPAAQLARGADDQIDLPEGAVEPEGDRGLSVGAEGGRRGVPAVLPQVDLDL